MSPFPMVLILTLRRAVANGSAFLLGWIGGCGVLGAIVLLVASDADASHSSGPAAWTGVVRLIAGVALLALSVKYWRGRPRGDQEPKLPGWMETIENFSAARAAGLGVLLSAVNPKNALLTVGGALAIAQTGVSTGDQVVAFAIFVVVASAWGSRSGSVSVWGPVPPTRSSEPRPGWQPTTM